MRKQRLTLCVAVTGFCIGMSMTALAGEWKQNNNAYWYQEDNGSYPANTWKWINGKCYYFDENGYMKTGWIDWEGKSYYCSENGDMLTNCMTPDNYLVGEDGAWIAQ